MSWREAVTAKHSDIWVGVPREWRVEALASKQDVLDVRSLLHASTSAVEQRVAGHTAVELLDILKQGDGSSQEVVRAFAHRAILAHQLTNCLSENNFAAADTRARELDAHFRTYRQPIGPLHGLPVSLMDRFHVANLDSACAFASWVGSKRTAAQEGTLVRILHSLGAVVLCKTNVPMSLLLGETTNNIVGTTVNPFDRRLSAGGACGGEGALIALRASHLGIGTDIAGSSRIPSAFCGLWALKCTQGRLPEDGIATVLSGLPTASGSIGLMSNDLTTLKLTLKSFLDSNLQLSDPNYIPLPWQHDILDSIRRRKGSLELQDGRLVFGVMRSDGHVRPHPSIERAITLVTDALLRHGHEIIEWDPPPHNPAVEDLFRILGSTSAVEARAALDSSGEPPVPQIAHWYQYQDIEPNTTADFWELCAKRHLYCTHYKSYWNSLGEKTRSGRIPDGVILPVTANLAVRAGEFHYYGYSAIANVLDYPSGVLPVTFGDCSLDDVSVAREPLNFMDEKVQISFQPEDIQGLPVACQVMCPRFQDEAVLGLMEAIAECLAARPLLKEQ